MNAKRLAAIVAAFFALIALGLSACGGSSDSTTASTASTPPPREAPRKPAEKTGGALTPPGTTLAFGQPATVTWVPPSTYNPAEAQRGSKLEVTVDAIEEGSIDDFSNVELEEAEKDSTPYYLHVTIKALEDVDGPEGDDPGVSLLAIDDRGQEQGNIIFTGEFDACSDHEPPSPFKTGESYESCLTYLIPDGGSIVTAEWNDGPSKANRVTPYFDEPVAWTGG